MIRASFEDDQLGCFVNIVVLYPSVSLFAIMEHPSLSQASSTFASLRISEYRQLVCDFADVIVVDPCMLCHCSCHFYLAFCAFLRDVCLSCHDLQRSECIELVNMPT